MKNKQNVIPKKKYSRVIAPNKISIKFSIRLREGLNEMAAEKGILVSELVILQNCIVQNIPDEDHRYYFFELTDNHILIREGRVKFLVYLPDDPGLCVSLLFRVMKR